MRQHITGLSLGIATAIATACEPPEHTTGAWRTVADTVGDTIVLRVVGNTERATLTLVPELRIGRLEGDSAYVFGKVSGLVPAADDGVYVWDELSKSIRQYDPAGRFVRQVGRSGGGPGEYRSIGGMTLVGGRLVFWDRSNQHVSVYDSAGTLVASWQPAYPRGPMGQLYPGIGEHVWLWHLTENPESHPGRGLQIGYIEYDVGGEATGDIVPRLRSGRDEGPPTIRATGTYRGKPSTIVDMVPFTAESVTAFSPYGYVVRGKGDEYAIVLARRHTPPVRIEREVAPVSVSDEERADAKARATAEMRAIDPRWTWNGPTIPMHKPFFRRLRVDPDGRIWVERAQPSVRLSDTQLIPEEPGRPPSRWREPIAYDVFTADGHFLGTLPVPEQASFRYMHGDTIWGVVRDSLNVDYVMRWRIEPSLSAVP
ncbi:MAG TPA: 6-bladed beta-propeller [Gemmatimonadaceae bacterium]|nr:6-bladed beta-propeller [Gemmatimonadaceae bacterium]